MSTPSLLNIPYRLKAGTLYSQLPETGAGDFTVSRTTTPTAGQSTRINSQGFIELVANNVPRLDYPLGGAVNGCPALLVEPAATNGIRNNSMVGAVAGSPGTMPTNWGTTLSGLTRTVVGTGTENGVAYLDIRFNGTATGTAIAIAYDANTIIAALQNQVWTHSVYARFTANVLNMPSLRVGMYEFNSGGTYLTEGFGSGVTLTSNLTRLSFTRTLTNASTAFVGAILQIPIVNGTSYDFTIRIGYPQMEQGTVATSVIPTTTAAVTRNTETIANTSATALIGQTEGTIYAEVNFSNLSAGSFISIDPGSGSDFILITKLSNLTIRVQLRRSSGSVVDIITSSAITLGSHKIALAYTNGNYALYIDGNAAGTSTNSTDYPASALTRCSLSNTSYGIFADRIRAFAIYPNRIPNTAAPGVLSLATLTAL